MSGSWWSEGEGGITVAVRVIPGARRSEVVGAPPVDGPQVDGSRPALRIRIAAPAHDGKANAELRRFLAARFGVRRSAVSIVRGERHRDKVVWIAGIFEPPPEMRDST